MPDYSQSGIGSPLKVSETMKPFYVSLHVQNTYRLRIEYVHVRGLFEDSTCKLRWLNE